MRKTGFNFTVPYNAMITPSMAMITMPGDAYSGLGNRDLLILSIRFPSAKNIITSRKEMEYTPARGASLPLVIYKTEMHSKKNTMSIR